MNIGLKCFAHYRGRKCDYKGSTSKAFRMDLLFAPADPGSHTREDVKLIFVKDKEHPWKPC